MYIAVSSMANLPQGVGQLSREGSREGLVDDPGFPASGDGGHPSSGTPNGIVLDCWDVLFHQYTTTVEIEASGFAEMFGFKATATDCAVVQETKRYGSSIMENGQRGEWGAAVRLSVVVFSGKMDGSLTLPNIAAKAQIDTIRARIGLSVVGYKGPLGQLLPAPGDLNVESFAIYIAAFKNIQSLVFGADGEQHLSPSFLGYDMDGA